MEAANSLSQRDADNKDSELAQFASDIHRLTSHVEAHENTIAQLKATIAQKDAAIAQISSTSGSLASKYQDLQVE